MNHQEILSLLESSTYDVIPLIEALDHTDDPADRALLKTRIAVNVGGEEQLCELFGLNSESLADFYSSMLQPNLSTEDTIDEFLNRYGNTSALAMPAADYDLSALEETPTVEPPEKEEDTTFQSIDAFLNANPAPARRQRPAAGATSEAIPESYAETALEEEEEVAEIGSESASEAGSKMQSGTPKQPETATLSEGLARIMIKNGNFSKALEIITDINLKNPEKSIYFADQIRFLRKLIANETKK